jgi:hypothetical protein
MESVLKILSQLDVYMSVGLGRLETMKALILGIISARTVNLKEVCSRFERGIESSNYRKVQYFFQKTLLNDAEIIRFIITHLFSPYEQVTLAIDRTDWEFGKIRHNLLCISVLYKETAIPLIILPLERKGNSNCEHRKMILKSLLSVIPAKKIKALLGDREFIGDEWFQILLENDIPFVMRVKDNMIIGLQDKTGKIKDLCQKQERKDVGFVHIGTQILQLNTLKNDDNLVAVISYNVDNPLGLYKKRWCIETGFKCLKSNGFNLEDTHLRHAERIKTLVQLCAIAMVIAFLSVDYVKETLPNIKKNTDTNSSPLSHMHDAYS